MIENIIYFVLACIVLTFSGIYLVKSLTNISKFLRISEFSAAFIIMAFATSIPELFVGISSAFAKNPELSLGNIIGANIIDLTLITGIIILLSGREIKFKSKKLGKDVYFMLTGILLLIVLYILGRSLSRIDGIILIVFFGIHIFRIFRKRKEYKKKMKDGLERERKFHWLLIFMMALVLLFVSSNFVVKYALKLAIDFNLPKIIIGLFLISIATTLPELVFGISASKTGHGEMAIGDQLGTIIANSALILGIVSIIHPIKVAFAPFMISGIFMFISAFLLITFIKTGKKLEKLEGISLILIYILFIIIEFFVK